MKLRPLCIVVVLALAARGLAHDFWIEPSSHRVATNEVIKVTLKVGDFAAGDRVPRNDPRIVEFAARVRDERRLIVGREGQDPAGVVRLESEGTCVLGFHSIPASVELEPTKFADYLREKGLEHVLAERTRLGESESKARELYSRCAKSLVRIGDGAQSGFDTVLGFPLELIPIDNPHELRWIESGEKSSLDALSLRLEFKGRPLANGLLTALDLDAPAPAPGAHQTPIEVRTDAEGRARVQLPHGGRWLIAAVHMVRASDPAIADWESSWASLTFEVPQLASSNARDPQRGD